VTSLPTPPESVIEEYDLDPASIRVLAGGLINRSFSARRSNGQECVLQCVNPIFPACINDDIDAVTRHLQRKGLTTPLLLGSRSGGLHVSAGNEIWRLLTKVRGVSHEELPTDEHASEAGRVLGNFHRALGDFDRPLKNRRPPVHDIERHLGNLRQALEAHDRHPAQADVAELSERIFAHARGIPHPVKSADRLVHGDPKISNVIFDKGKGICMIDLDTITRIPVAVELGDALRSWCNPDTEDSAEADFCLERFRLALEGYRGAAPDLLSRTEWQAVPNAARSIAIELAARFAADALNESYFGWDNARFASASEHNLARARAQLQLGERIERQLPAMNDFVMTLR
jgi:Ser/Thr protein kinase RdoA (MazF antagonist)